MGGFERIYELILAFRNLRVIIFNLACEFAHLFLKSLHVILLFLARPLSRLTLFLILFRFPCARLKGADGLESEVVILLLLLLVVLSLGSGGEDGRRGQDKWFVPKLLHYYDQL